MKKIILGILSITAILFAEITTFNNTQSSINNQIGFEENFGQVANFENNQIPSVLFRINLPEYSLYLSENSASFVIYRQENEQVHFVRLDVEPLNGKIEKSKIELSNPISGYSHYYLSHCPEGVLFVKSYRQIKIKDLYPGIDWIWRYDDKVHSEFEVKPNADISKIKLRVKWADTEIKDGKEIIYSTPLGKIREGELYVYEKDGSNVSAFYQQDQQGFITFNIKEYDKNKTLIVDPPFERLWATYYGGSDYDNCDGSREMGAITTDPSGNVLITGFTKSTNFPTQNPGGGAYFQSSVAGQIDVFIAKFTNSGERIWVTYYGGSADDIGTALTTDVSENLFVTGNTFSSNFPTYNPGSGAYFQPSIGGSGDAFILKFNNAGIRQWATFYGGGLSDVGYAVATNHLGAIYIGGNTFSSNFPVYNPGSNAYFQGTNAGSFDGFIVKFNNNGVRLWATYYGGSDEDHIYSIATDNLFGVTDSFYNLFVTGMTRSTNFPIHNPGSGAYFQGNIQGYRTAFVLKFNNAGERIWATYYSGSTNDYGRAIATDGYGNLFVVGNTSSNNFPTYDGGGGAYYQGALGGIDDVFILKFTNNGIRLWATYYGGSVSDIGRSLAVHNSGKIYITGNTLSSNFPIYNPGGGAFYQPNLGGGHDAFILGFNNSGVREWATYYGGASTDYGMSIVTDGPGNIFLTGFTLSSAFPVYNPSGSAYYQGTNAGSYDAYVLKFASPFTGIQEEPIISKYHSPQIQCNTFFTDRIVIRFNGSNEKEFKVTIYNSLGANLYSKTTVSASQLILNDERIRNLKSGVYFVKINDNNQRLAELKLIKK